jgi:hypothetical protein
MKWTHLHYLNDPEQWRLRAREAGAHVEKINDPEARRILLEIVGRYERLAKRAEKSLVWDQKAAMEAERHCGGEPQIR